MARRHVPVFACRHRTRGDGGDTPSGEHSCSDTRQDFYRPPELRQRTPPREKFTQCGPWRLPGGLAQLDQFADDLRGRERGTVPCRPGRLAVKFGERHRRYRRGGSIERRLGSLYEGRADALSDRGAHDPEPSAGPPRGRHVRGEGGHGHDAAERRWPARAGIAVVAGGRDDDDLLAVLALPLPDELESAIDGKRRIVVLR